MNKFNIRKYPMEKGPTSGGWYPRNSSQPTDNDDVIVMMTTMTNINKQLKLKND